MSALRAMCVSPFKLSVRPLAVRILAPALGALVHVGMFGVSNPAHGTVLLVPVKGTVVGAEAGGQNDAAAPGAPLVLDGDDVHGEHINVLVPVRLEVQAHRLDDRIR